MRTFSKMLLAVTIDPQQVGTRIRDARIAKGWTQLDFAYAANVSPSTVARWEQGTLPPIRELNRIASVLGVSSETLVDSPSPRGEEERWDQLEAEVAATRADVQKILAILGGGEVRAASG